MSGATPLRSYHGTSLMSCDRMSAGGGHREDYREEELEEHEEGTGKQRKRKRGGGKREDKLENEQACQFY